MVSCHWSLFRVSVLRFWFSLNFLTLPRLSLPWKPLVVPFGRERNLRVFNWEPLDEKSVCGSYSKNTIGFQLFRWKGCTFHTHLKKHQLRKLVLKDWFYSQKEDKNNLGWLVFFHFSEWCNRFKSSSLKIKKRNYKAFNMEKNHNYTFFSFRLWSIDTQRKGAMKTQIAQMGQKRRRNTQTTKTEQYKQWRTDERNRRIQRELFLGTKRRGDERLLCGFPSQPLSTACRCLYILWLKSFSPHRLSILWAQG